MGERQLFLLSRCLNNVLIEHASTVVLDVMITALILGNIVIAAVTTSTADICVGVA